MSDSGMSSQDHSESESHSPCGTVKKARYSCKFNDDWLKEFNFVSKSSKGIEYVRCKACGSDFAIGNGGRSDVTKHSQTSSHAKNMKAFQFSYRITSFVARGQDACDRVLAAEVKFAYYVAQRNLPFTVCDDFSKMVGDMFPDSDIAKKYGMGKTKARL